MSEATKTPTSAGRSAPATSSRSPSPSSFSGICYSDAWYGIFDFTVLDGEFGRLVSSVTTGAEGDLVTAMSNYRGKGGSGAIDGFMFALARPLDPLLRRDGDGVRALRRCAPRPGASPPFFRPGMGLPGTTTLAIIASLQSTDAGAALTRSLKDSGQLTEREANIFATFK